MAISLLMLTRRQPAAHFADARTGYGHASRSQRAVSAGLALAIAGGVGATLMLALVAPKLTREAPVVFTGTHIPVTQPEDPVIMPDPIPQTPTRSRITIPRDSPIPPLAEAPTGEVLDRWVPPPAGPEVGSGELTGGTTTIPDPVPEPVWRTATRDPRYARAFQPPYPPSAEREGLEGTAQVRVRINADGRVVAVENISATDERFFAATERQALRHWRFRPATRDGVAVESTQVLTVTFRITSTD